MFLKFDVACGTKSPHHLSKAIPIIIRPKEHIKRSWQNSRFRTVEPREYRVAH